MTYGKRCSPFSVKTFFYPTDYSIERLCHHLNDEKFKKVKLIGPDSIRRHLEHTLRVHGIELTVHTENMCCALLIPPVLEGGAKPSASAIARALSIAGARPLFVFAPFQEMLFDPQAYGIDNFAALLHTSSEYVLAADHRVNQVKEYFTLRARDRLAWICYNTMFSHRIAPYDTDHVKASLNDSHMMFRYQPVNTIDLDYFGLNSCMS